MCVQKVGLASIRFPQEEELENHSKLLGSIPKSYKGLRACLFRFYKVAKAKIKSEIDEKIQNGIRFSFSTDEYTSIQNGRYFNVHVHFTDRLDFTILG